MPLSYFAMYFNSPSIDLMPFLTGIDQVKLNRKAMDRIPVPVPPLPEQEEIVHRVHELFALADQLEARYAKAKAHVEKLTQAILAKAFRGELVPQDPNDEPASVLLDRIRAERPSQTRGRQRSGTPRQTRGSPHHT
jgi:type I restriction enzyme S subunit